MSVFKDFQGLKSLEKIEGLAKTGISLTFPFPPLLSPLLPFPFLPFFSPPLPFNGGPDVTPEFF